MLLRSAIAGESGSVRAGTMRTVNARAPGALGLYATNLLLDAARASNEGGGDDSAVGSAGGGRHAPNERVTIARRAVESTSPVIAIQACSGRGRSLSSRSPGNERGGFDDRTTPGRSTVWPRRRVVRVAGSRMLDRDVAPVEMPAPTGEAQRRSTAATAAAGTRSASTSNWRGSVCWMAIAWPYSEASERSESRA